MASVRPQLSLGVSQQGLPLLTKKNYIYIAFCIIYIKKRHYGCRCVVEMIRAAGRFPTVYRRPTGVVVLTVNINSAEGAERREKSLFIIYGGKGRIIFVFRPPSPLWRGWRGQINNCRLLRWNMLTAQGDEKASADFINPVVNISLYNNAAYASLWWRHDHFSLSTNSNFCRKYFRPICIIGL